MATAHASKKGTLLSDSRLVVGAVHGPILDGDAGVAKVQWAMVRADAWALWLADHSDLLFPLDGGPWGARHHDGDSAMALLYDEDPKAARAVKALREKATRKFTATYETYTPISEADNA